MKNLNFRLVLLTLAISYFGSFHSAKAQTPGPVVVGGNQYAFYYATATNYGLYFNATAAAYEFKDNTATTVFSVNANTGRVDANGVLFANANIRFGSNSDLLIDADRYAFRYRLGTNFGLFFNATNARYEFRNSTAASVFYIAANTGNLVAAGGIQIGNSTLANPGNIRWTGSDFQGYNGSAWVSLTGGGGSSLPSGVQSQILYHNGTDWTATDAIRIAANGRSFIGMAVGSTTPSASISTVNIHQTVYRSTTGAGHTGVYAERGGNTSPTSGGTAWTPAGVDAAIKGNSVIGNRWSSALAGFSGMNYDNTAAVFGGHAQNPTWGALGYRATGGEEYAGYFNGRNRVQFNPSGNSSLYDIGVLIGSTNFVYPGLSLTHPDSVSGNMGGAFYGINWAGGINLGDAIGIGWEELNAGAFNVLSDRTMKRNIETITPENYEQYLSYLRNIESATFKYNYETDSRRPHNHIGVIAQTLPEEVQAKATEKPGQKSREVLGMSLADMSGLHTVAIKALDAKVSQQADQLAAKDAQIEELNERLNRLENLLDRMEQHFGQCCESKKVQPAIPGETIRPGLEQNRPNPFNGNTLISYFLPENVISASIVVYDMRGQAVQSISLNQKGSGTVEFSSNDLPSGVYFYTLIADGVKTDSKRMVINK